MTWLLFSAKDNISRKSVCRKCYPDLSVLTHWGRVTHICVVKLVIIGSDNGLSPGRRQAIIWTNAGILLIGPLGTNFSENLSTILTFSFTEMRLKVSSAKWRPFCLGLNVLRKCLWKWSLPWVAAGHSVTEIYRLSVPFLFRFPWFSPLLYQVWLTGPGTVWENEWMGDTRSRHRWARDWMGVDRTIWRSECGPTLSIAGPGTLAIRRHAISRIKVFMMYKK